jgi:hypothetical protein
MKARTIRFPGAACILACMSLALLAASCQASLASGAETAQVRLALSSADTDLGAPRTLDPQSSPARTISPDFSSKLVYAVTGSSTGGATYSDSFASAPISFSVKPGIWSFSVAVTLNGASILSGSVTGVEVSPYATAAIPLSLARVAGNGTLSLSYSFGTGVAYSSAAALSVAVLSGGTAPTSPTWSGSGPLTYSGSLAAGDYLVTSSITATSSGVSYTYYVYETVQIFNGATSSLAKAISSGDLTGAGTTVTGVYLALPNTRSYYLSCASGSAATSETVSALINPTNAIYTSLAWSSSNAGVATVTANSVSSGVAGATVTAVAAGSATITFSLSDSASGSSYSDSISFTVLGSTTLATGAAGPAAGYIFYDAGNYTTYGWRYLECTPSDQSSYAPWWNGSYISVSTGTAVGTGAANTATIIAAQGVGIYAAYLCANLSQGGYHDWFLPSTGEFSLLYTNLIKKGLGGLTSNSYYWCSSQYSSTAAYVDYYNISSSTYSLTNTNSDKSTSYMVRAIRAF